MSKERADVIRKAEDLDNCDREILTDDNWICQNNALTPTLEFSVNEDLS